jgi:hypothetical protein
MTFTLAPDTVYFLLCLFLLLLQLYHYYQLRKIKKEVQDVWLQIGVLITTLSAKLQDIEKRISDNEENRKN